MLTQREIKQIIPAQPTSDGDGVKISRVAGFNNANFSPFLMLDEFKSDQKADYIGGFRIPSSSTPRNRNSHLYAKWAFPTSRSYG